MLHVLVLRYTVPADQVAGQVSGHVSYLDRGHATGRFLLSGQTIPSDLGGVILAVGERDEIERLAAEDPFITAGVGEYEILTVEPARMDENLAELLDRARQVRRPWDDAALTRLRTGDVSVLGEGRPLRPVLQHAGQALLEAGVIESSELAQACVRELSDRDWAGDDVLVWELRVALGKPADAAALGLEPGATPEPVPVELGELAGCLDGDPLQGGGAVDLKTGEIYHPGTLEYDRPAELDEDSDDFDPDRWLFFQPDSREGYQDMADFISELENEATGRLPERLWRALDGRGAFRRFRDVLHDADPSYLARWHLFRDERELGRAREWLAEAGYRSDPARSRR